MTWTAPDLPEIDELLVGGEREMLDRWLHVQRSALLARCAGLRPDQLVRPSLPPSPLSLLGLLRHVADMERAWIRRRLAGLDLPMIYPGEDACFHQARAEGAEADYATLLAEWDEVDAELMTRDLDEIYTHPEYGSMSLRWMYQHILREYAGHIGHADLLREQLDGTTFS